MLSLIVLLLISTLVECQYNDICGLHHGKKFFLEHGESGSVVADFKDNVVETNASSTYSRCKVEFVTCSSCIIEIQFRYLNISRNCGRSPVIDTCGCDYVWIYEPHIDDTSGEQFCGRFMKSNTSELTYVSQTRNVAITFVYNNEYGHAFTLDYFTKTGTTELTIRQGLTSNQPYVEVLKYPMAHYVSPRQKEHVVPITQGFYVRLRGVFTPQTRLAIVYAAFNYKDCFGGSDFLCENMRCIPILLNCDGFDHCGDNSDESNNCSQDPKDHREYSKIPNFLFPKIEPYSDLTTATFVFLTCSFGLIGVILAMALLLYRVNVRARHQRQIQDHIETIHAILEESVGDVEEEIIVPDDPPDYEPPPDYNELVKIKYYKNLAEVKLQEK
ncbi:unnamed protein product, partial [Callosobruchus maculatus]